MSAIFKTFLQPIFSFPLFNNFYSLLVQILIYIYIYLFYAIKNKVAPPPPLWCGYSRARSRHT